MIRKIKKKLLMFENNYIYLNFIYYLKEKLILLLILNDKLIKFIKYKK